MTKPVDLPHIVTPEMARRVAGRRSDALEVVVPKTALDEPYEGMFIRLDTDLRKGEYRIVTEPRDEGDNWRLVLVRHEQADYAWDADPDHVRKARP